MLYEDLKALSDKVNAVYNRHDLEELKTLLAPNFVVHTTTVPGGVLNRDGTLMMWQAYWNAFPDMKNELQDTLVDGDKVAVRLACTGTHLGEFQGIPPTGKVVRNDVIDIIRYENGQEQEEWFEFNLLGFLQQLGVVPAPMAA